MNREAQDGLDQMMENLTYAFSGTTSAWPEFRQRLQLFFLKPSSLAGWRENPARPQLTSILSEGLFDSGSTASFYCPLEVFETTTQTPSKIAELEARIAVLEQKIADLKPETSDRIILIRTVPREEAKTEILALFREGEVLDYGSIVDRLGLDLQLVVEICNELEAEGIIG